jgi:hypothetical protein
MRRAGISSVPDGTADYIRERARQWRREIVQARIALADEAMNAARQVELWQIVDRCELSLKMLVLDFPSELERIDREIEGELRR